MYTGGAVYYGFTAIFEPIADELGWSYTQISLASSLRGVEASLLAPVVGTIVDRFGPRRLMFFGVALTGIGLFLLSQTYTLASFYGAFVLISLGASTTSVTVIMTVVAQWFRRRIGLASGITVCGFACGALMLPIINALIVDYDWRVAVTVLAGGTIIILLPVLLLLRNRPDLSSEQGSQELSVSSPGSVAAQSAGDGEVNATVRQALRTRAFWHILVAFTLFNVVIISVITHVMPYLSSVSVTRSTASLVTMAIPLLSIIGRLGMGWWGDRRSRHWVLALSLLLTGFGIACFAMVGVRTLWLVPFLIAYAIGYGGTMALRPAMIREYFGRLHFGGIFGLVLGISMLGGVIGAPLAGRVFDVTGGYQLIWFVYAGLSLLAVFAVLTCPKGSGLPR